MASTRASVLCSLCGETGTVETDIDKPEGVATALAWAQHFVTKHPGLKASGHLIAVDIEPETSAS